MLTVRTLGRPLALTLLIALLVPVFAATALGENAHVRRGHHDPYAGYDQRSIHHRSHGLHDAHRKHVQHGIVPPNDKRGLVRPHYDRPHYYDRSHLDRRYHRRHRVDVNAQQIIVDTRGQRDGAVVIERERDRNGRRTTIERSTGAQRISPDSGVRIVTNPNARDASRQPRHIDRNTSRREARVHSRGDHRRDERPHHDRAQERRKAPEHTTQPPRIRQYDDNAYRYEGHQGSGRIVIHDQHTSHKTSRRHRDKPRYDKDDSWKDHRFDHRRYNSHRKLGTFDRFKFHRFYRTPSLRFYRYHHGLKLHTGTRFHRGSRFKLHKGLHHRLFDHRFRHHGSHKRGHGATFRLHLQF